MSTSATKSASASGAVVSLGLLLTLGACASSEIRDGADKPAVVPDQWQANALSPRPIEDGWLEALGMPELMPLVAEALKANTDLRTAAARFEQASWQAAIEEGAAAPTLDLSLGARRDRSSQAIAGGGRDAVYVSEHTLTLDLTWEVDLWGRIRANTDAANSELYASRHDYHAARLSLAAQTAQLLVDLSAASLLRDLTAERVASLEGTVQRVMRRYERGLTTAFDLRLAESDLSSASADLAVRADQEARAGRALEILLGRYPANRIDGLKRLPRLSRSIPIGLPATLLERRPDMAAERARLHAAGYRIKAAKAELLPRISLTASGGTSSEQFEKLFDVDFLIASIAGNLVQPIFQGGRLRNRVALNKAAEKEALSTYVERALQAFREVEDALGAERWLERQEEALTLALGKATSAERLAEAQYERGLIPVLELLTAQRGRLDAKDRLLDVRRQRINNRITLHLALGGDFAARPADRESNQSEHSS